MEHRPLKGHLRGKIVQRSLDITGSKKCGADSPDIFGFSGKFLADIRNYGLFEITLAGSIPRRGGLPAGLHRNAGARNNWEYRVVLSHW